jgi:CRP-like cAMP-binding protein
MHNSFAASLEHAQLIRKLESIAELSVADKLALNSLPLSSRLVPADQDVVRDHDHPTRCCLLVEGLMHRYKMLQNGGRQIMAFHVPGDFVDLHSLHLGTMDHNIGTLVPSRVAFVPHAALLDLTRDNPGIAAAFWRDTLIDAAVFREWIVNLGRRDSYQRIAHLFCELYLKLKAVGRADDDGYILSLTQAEIADATGITVVHVNRTLKDLRANRLVAMEGRFLRILDWEALQVVAGFDPTYLHLKMV